MIPDFRRFSKELISLPTFPLFSSPTSACTSDTLSPQLLRALHYISNKLQAKRLHVNYILHDTSKGRIQHSKDQSIILIPIGRQTAKTHRALHKIVLKAEKKHFFIGNAWLHDLVRQRPKHEALSDHHLIRRSLLQNEILFSSEALTILAIDHVYAFKCRLQEYSRLHRRSASNAAVDELHRVSRVYGSTPPVSMSYLARVYDHLAVDERAVRDINDAYVAKYDHDGIAFTPQPNAKSPLPVLSIFCPSCSQPERQSTPLTDEDLTPTTKSEWNHFLTSQRLVSPGNEPQVLSLCA